MVIGSSSLPASLISCMSVLPMAVTRSETSMGLPSSVPCQEPASVFKLSKDFCGSDAANPVLESPIRTTGIRKRWNFMFHSPCSVSGQGDWLQVPLALLLYLTTTPFHMSSSFLLPWLEGCPED